MSLLNQNQTLRTNGQDERTVSSGFIGDPQPSLSSEGARLGRTANSGAYEVSFNSQFIRMMFVCHHVICPCDKTSLKDTGQNKGTGGSKSPRTQTSKETLIKHVCPGFGKFMK